jgi:hypothetical protein
MDLLLTKLTRSLVTGKVSSFHLQRESDSFQAWRDGKKLSIPSLEVSHDIVAAIECLTQFGIFKLEVGYVSEFTWNQRLIRWNQRPMVELSGKTKLKNFLFKSQTDENLLIAAGRFGAREDMYLVVDGNIFFAVQFNDGSNTFVQFDGSSLYTGAVGNVQIIPVDKDWKASSTLCTNLQSKIIAKHPPVAYAREVVSHGELTWIRIHKFQDSFNPYDSEDIREWIHHLGLVWDHQYGDFKFVEMDLGKSTLEQGRIAFKFDSGLIADSFQDLIGEKKVPLANDSLMTMDFSEDKYGHGEMLLSAGYTEEIEENLDALFFLEGFEIRISAAHRRQPDD